MKRKVKVSSIFDILMLISLGAFLFYCFWYQYAVGEIKGIMSFFGIEILLLDFYYLMRGRKIKYLAAMIQSSPARQKKQKNRSRLKQTSRSDSGSKKIYLKTPKS